MCNLYPLIHIMYVSIEKMSHKFGIKYPPIDIDD